MQIVKDPLTEEVLLANIESKVPVYSQLEVEFLRQYAQHVFTAKSIDELLKDEDGRFGINHDIFNIIIRMDVSIYGGENLENLAQEKAHKLNPLLSLLGIEGVVIGNDPISTLYQLKIKGLEALKRTATSAFALKLREKESDKFAPERDELCDIFQEPSLPIFVYGSYFRKGNNARDIDTMVLPAVFNEETYRKIAGKIDRQRKPELSFVIVPRDYLYWFALSDHGDKFLPRGSVMINGSVYIPSFDEEYRKRLKIHGAVSDYTRLRAALTSDGINGCQGIVRRINSYLKTPKFIFMGMTQTPDQTPESELLELGIKQFESLPPRNILIAELVRVNMQAYRILLAYQNK